MGEKCSETYSWKDSRTLYVILQGEFALYREPTDNPTSDTLHIMAPWVDGHKYKAGKWLTNWKTEGDLPASGRLSLRNVAGDCKQAMRHCGRAVPEDNSDIFLKLGRESPCYQKAYVHITAPMPLAILPGLRETTPSVFMQITESDGSLTYPPVTATPTVIPILVYKWYAGEPPFLWDDGNHCMFTGSGGPSDDFQSLHIYASAAAAEPNPGSASETEIEAEKQHIVAAFSACAALLGVNATANWIDNDSNMIKLYAVPPAGLSWAQVNLTLAQVMGHSPDQLKQDRLHVTTPNVVDSGNCGPLTG